jgi:uncharacterized membrane protein
MKENLSKKIAFTACLATIVCVTTYAIAIPLPIGGYFNAGDIFVLLCGWLIGPWYGALAAGLGAALADCFLGYFPYAPATFIIKGAVSITAWGVYALFKKWIKKEVVDFLPRLTAGLLAESVMVVGYFLFEALVLQLGVGAVGNILGNAIQGLCGMVGGVAIISVLYPLPKINRIFPLIKVK